MWPHEPVLLFSMTFVMKCGSYSHNPNPNITTLTQGILVILCGQKTVLAISLDMFYI